MSDVGFSTRRDDADLHFCGFHNLMPHRVEHVLLVSSLYESFILEEEGLLSELITQKYTDLRLSHAPRVSRVSTDPEAIEFIQDQRVDLVITMASHAQRNLLEFARAVKVVDDKLPVVVLASEPRELARHPELGQSPHIDRTFVWSGDARILLAIIKYVEDMLNAEHDTQVGDVRVIILVENSVRFYSTYLPLIYSEVVNLTRSLIAEQINVMQQLLRLRARPKILLAETFEEAYELYDKYRDYLLGVISDIRFPKNGEMTDDAGIQFARLIRQEAPYLPMALQSSNTSFATVAKELKVAFVDKRSPNLLRDLRRFLQNNMGFADFVFVVPDGHEVGRASDLQSFADQMARVPEESLVLHAMSNHFSNWLMARTEFELATRIRPHKVSDFATVGEMRTYLLETLAEFRERSQSGVIADFSPRRLSQPANFMRIGGGSIGGKARGLAFVNALIRRHNLRHRFEGICISVPNSAAIGTNVFDTFLDENNLRTVVAEETRDDRIAEAFLAAKLTKSIYSDLTAFLRHVQYPLAVRSSSLLEDSPDRPFAGVYTTHMIPNNHAKLKIRRDQLCEAIKLVYASTFFTAARRYLEATGRHAEEEKMGVILQELVGSVHDGRYYPTFSGVARSSNYYPTGRLKPEDGVAAVALGLGKMVCEGGQSLIFSPAVPTTLPQFPTTKDLLSFSQREFFALDLRHPDVYPTPDANANLLRPGLDVAEADGTLAPIGSVYSPENDAVYDGIHRDGTRLVTFAHVLKSDLFPLADILRLLLEIGVDGMACPIEIEFAVDMDVRPMEFGFLQMRPIVSQEESVDASLADIDPKDTICHSPLALGNGRMSAIRDIVYVKPDAFDAGKTREIAAELADINNGLIQAGRKCILIGPGRWGSADRWLGIPVSWDQISSAQVIVETTLEDFLVTPSQGTHFFQNLTSLGVGYFNVDPTLGQGSIDWDWLASREAVKETGFVRHIRLPKQLDVRLDGRSRQGIIVKPAK